MLVSIDEGDSRPIYLQIVSQIKGQIQSGELKPGDELLPVREVAESLGINLHTVRSAYQKLRDQGIINLRLGRRARVARLRRHPASADEVDTVLKKRLEELKTEAFLLGLSTDEFRRLVDRIVEGSDGSGKRKNKEANP